MKKKSIYLLIALVASFAIFTTSCQKDDLAVEDEVMLKSGELQTITQVDGNYLTGAVTENTFFPRNLEGNLWNFRIEFKVTIPETYDMPEGTMYKIQGGLTAGSYLDRWNESANYPWYLYNLEIRKQTKKNLILQGGPLGSIDYDDEKIYDGLNWDSYFVFFSKEFTECGPQEVTGEWTVSWIEENVWVEDPDSDPTTLDGGYFDIEHVIGMADPLVFDVPCE